MNTFLSGFLHPCTVAGWAGYNSRWCAVHHCTVHHCTLFSITVRTVMFSLSLKVWQEGTSHQRGKYATPSLQHRRTYHSPPPSQAAPWQSFKSSKLTRARWQWPGWSNYYYFFKSKITGYIPFFFLPFVGGEKWAWNVTNNFDNNCYNIGKL